MLHRIDLQEDRGELCIEIQRERRSHLANNYGPEGLKWTTHTSPERPWSWCTGPPWSMPPPAELRRRPQDGISCIQKVAIVEIGFRGALGCFQGIWVYIGERSRSGEPRGALKGGGVPHCLVASLFLSWRPLQVSWIAFVQKTTLPEVSFRLGSVLYSFSAKHWNRKNSNLHWAFG